jgi:hypothetical protein
MSTRSTQRRLEKLAHSPETLLAAFHQKLTVPLQEALFSVGPDGAVELNALVVPTSAAAAIRVLLARRVIMRADGIVRRLRSTCGVSSGGWGGAAGCGGRFGAAEQRRSVGKRGE